MKKNPFIYAVFCSSLFAVSHCFSVITVNNTSQLINAINTANTTPETIEFGANITLDTPLPVINNTYTIDGKGFTLDGDGTYRGFIILDENSSNIMPTIQNITITNAQAKGGDGGSPRENSTVGSGGGGGGLGAGAGLYTGNNSVTNIKAVFIQNSEAIGGDALSASTTGVIGGSGGGGLGGNGATNGSDGPGGGGGGRLKSEDGSPGTSGVGGAGGGTTGGKGGDITPISGTSGEDGLYGGGGGGSPAGSTSAGSLSAGAGGFGGGGGGGGTFSGGTGSITGTGGAGGYGGGGGGARSGPSANGGTGGFGAGNGQDSTTGSIGGQGGGGAGLGGAIFIDHDSTLIIEASTAGEYIPFSGNSVTAGTGFENGQALGPDIFVASGGDIELRPGSGVTLKFNNPIISDNLGGNTLIQLSTEGTVDLRGLTNDFTGSIAVVDGILQIDGGGFGSIDKLFLSGGTLDASGTLPTATTALIDNTSGSTISVPNGETFTIPKEIRQNTTQPLTKSGEGTLVLQGQSATEGNPWTTDLEISAGTVSISTSNALPAPSAGINLAGTLQITNIVSVANQVTVTGISSTIDVTTGGSAGFTKELQGSGTVTKTGEGSLDLPNGIANGITVNLNEGVLSGNEDSLNPSPINLNGGELAFTLTANLPYTGTLTANNNSTISVTGSSLSLDTGILTGGDSVVVAIKGDNTVKVVPNAYTGGFSVDPTATLQIGSELFSNSSSPKATRAIFATLNGPLSGIGDLRIVGNPTQDDVLVLTSASSYDGDVEIANVTLETSNAIAFNGTSTINDSAVFNTLSNTLILNNLAGSGDLTKTGPGVLDIGGDTSSYTGSIMISEGQIIGIDLGEQDLELDGGDLDLPSDTNPERTATTTLVGDSSVSVIGTGTSTITGQIVDGTSSGSLTKLEEGTLRIVNDGNTYSGGTTVQAGVLEVSGSAPLGTGDVTIETTGTLRGQGTIAGSVTNAGVLAPEQILTMQDSPAAQSIATLNLGTDLDTTAGTVEIELAPTAIHDIIAVEGKASLGGTLTLIPTGNLDQYPPGLEFPILTTQGSLNGEFATIINNSPLVLNVEYRENTSNLFGLLGTTVVVSIGGVTFTLPLDQIPAGNARRVGAYLVECGTSMDPDVVKIQEGLLSLDLPDLIDALDQISAQRFGAVAYNQFNSSQTMANLFAHHLRQYVRPGQCCDPQKEARVWVQLVGDRLTQKERKDRIEHTSREYGGALGGNYVVNDNTSFGLGVGYTSNNLDWKEEQGEAKLRTYYAALHALFHSTTGYIDLGVQVAKNKVSSQRVVRFADINRVAKASFGRYSLTGSMEAAYHTRSFVEIQPVVGLYATYISQDEFKESGAERLNLEVASTSFAFFRGTLGVNFYDTFTFSDTCCTIGVYAGLQRDETIKESNMKARLFEYCANHDFKSKTYQDEMTYGVGKAFANCSWNSFGLGLEYAYTGGSSYSEHRGTVGMELEF